MHNTVMLIASRAHAAEAEQLEAFLCEQGTFLRKSYEDGYIVLEDVDGKLSNDCAVVFVSGDASADDGWQNCVRALSSQVRIIPVAMSYEVDVNNPDVIPESVEKINFIRHDAFYQRNVWESVTVDEAFFEVKNHLLMLYDSWTISARSDTLLMTDLKQIHRYMKMLSDRMTGSDDAYSVDQLTRLNEYLSASEDYARKIQRKKRFTVLRTAALSLLAIACIVIIVVAVQYLSKAKKSSIYLSLKVDAYNAPDTAIYMLDALDNPFLKEEVKESYRRVLSECLGYNWSSAHLPASYWALNDARLCDDTRYLWAATGEGHLSKWDNYTGKTVIDIKVSGSPLIVGYVADSEDYYAAVDQEAILYLSKDAEHWTTTDLSGIAPYASRSGAHLAFAADHSTLVLSGSQNIDFFSMKGGVQHLRSLSFDYIFDTEVNEDGTVTALILSGDGYYVIRTGADEADDAYFQLDRGVRNNSQNTDIRNGVVVFFDENRDLVTVDTNRDYALTYGGLQATAPIDVCFVNDDVIAYIDRNRGTRVYDMALHLDLGCVLIDQLSRNIDARGNTVMGSSTGRILTEDISELLAQKDVDKAELKPIVDTAAPDGTGAVERLSLLREDILRIDLRGDNGEKPIIVDTGSWYFASLEQRDSSFLDGIDTTYNYEHPQICFNGVFTYAALTDGGDTYLIGGSDGTFYEIAIRSDGSYLICSSRKVPSHAAVAGVYTDGENYYIEDAAGTLWLSPIRSDIFTQEGAIKAVREKLRGPIYASTAKEVSGSILRAVDATVIEGSEYYPGEEE